MGHRRVGLLPKTKKWRSIVEAIGPASQSAKATESLVAATLDGVRERFRGIEDDKAVNASFKYLVLLAVASRSADIGNTMRDVGAPLKGEPTPIGLARTLTEYVDSNSDSVEYAALARGAATDAIAAWHAQHPAEGPGLFAEGNLAETPWRGAGTGAGFCELARSYFSKFTERHLTYLLDREASSQVKTIADREQFDKNLRSGIDAVSQHAFEISKITQSFAAGWFNKYAAKGVPTDSQIKRFLSVAFGKLREELRREGLP